MKGGNINTDENVSANQENKLNFWCGLIGHRLIPIYIKGEYNGELVKFIGAYCSRCGMGEKELHDISNVAINKEYCTYSEKFYKI